MTKASPVWDVDFHSIRSLDGSKDNAFEEFCAQIARRTPGVPAGSTFIRYRGAGGDGGVECIWRLPNGKEWGWQAKYFFNLDKQQIDKSVSAALAIHPNLERYTICIPFDLTGPTGRAGSNESTRFLNWVEEWRKQAAERGMSVEYLLMTKFDLLDALLSFDPDHARIRFWFDEARFGRNWFGSRLEEAIAAAGPRYSPKLRIDVPAAASIEAFGRTGAWVETVRAKHEQFESIADHWSRTINERDWSSEQSDFPDDVKPDAELLADLLATIDSALATLVAGNADDTLLTSATNALDEARDLAWRLEARLREALEDKHGTGVADSVGWRQFMMEYQVSFPARHLDRCREVIGHLNELIDWFINGPARFVTTPTMLIEGPAGVGKTHLICDAAQQRRDRGLPSVILMGGQFVNAEPWSQVQQLLGVSATLSRDEFLGILDVAGECSGYPCIIFIDALNETQPRSFWRTFLPQMTQAVRRFPWLKLCISCRTVYRDLVIPEHHEIQSLTHTGFEGVEFDAIPEFFRFYEIETPVMPLMQPEFANPLFLRLICESLHDAGEQHLPDGFMGIAAASRFLLEQKNRKLAERLDYAPQEQRVQVVIRALIEAMVEAGQTWLPRAAAKGVVEGLSPSRDWSSSLFNHLIQEGLLLEDRVFDVDAGSMEDVIRFGFERLAEHWIAERYLDDLDHDALQQALNHGGSLYFLVEEEWAIHRNRGVLAALSVLVPEQYGEELFALIAETGARRAIERVAVNALMWRSHYSLGDQITSLLASMITERADFRLALDALLAVVVRPESPINARWLHDQLANIAMPDRDALLCPYCHHNYGERTGLDRLIRWAWEADLTVVSEEACELWLTALSWLFVASDRRVRDWATKAAVRLLGRHITIAPSLVDRFIGVDDEYVIERVLAAVYGALLRAGGANTLRLTADSLYERCFRNGGLPQNAMVRDYARLILELAHARGVLSPGVSLESIRPPYKSDWPLTMPDDSFIAGFRESYAELPKLYRSCFDDDFARYTISHGLREYEGISESDAKGWIFAHVLEMGYTSERFARFDRHMVQKYGPGRGRPEWAERIGKKYQWIALYRLMARLGDHLQQKTDPWTPPPPETPGLQAGSYRNIDPSNLLESDHAEENTEAWWVNSRYTFKEESWADRDWLATDDYPETTAFLKVASPTNSRPLLLLQAYLNWNNSPAGQRSYKYPFRQLWMHVFSYIVPRDQIAKCRRWATRRYFYNGVMLSEFENHDTFLGEYPFAVSCRNWYSLYLHQREIGRLSFNAEPTVAFVHSSFQPDASKKDATRMHAPAPIFFQSDDLAWNGGDGYTSGDITVFRSPSMTQPGPAALLADEEYLTRFLKNHDAVLLWTVLAEKVIVTGGPGGRGYGKHSQAHILSDGRISNVKPISDLVWHGVDETDGSG